MPWPFSRRLTGKSAEIATQVVRHLQTQVALQQLAKETYDTAMSKAAGSVNMSGSVLVRDIGTIVDPGPVDQYLVPATETKVDFIKKMDAEHRAFNAIQQANKSHDAYESWTKFLTLALARSQLQLECWKDYVSDPSLDLSERINSLDEAEDASLMVSLTALNQLIKRAGLEGEPWLTINCAAFNDVRNRIELPPLTEPEFRSRFYKGMAGEPTSFFE